MFTPPPGTLRRNPHTKNDLLKVIGALKQEMSFEVRSKKYSGMEIVLDPNGNDIGHEAYDLLRYFKYLF